MKPRKPKPRREVVHSLDPLIRIADALELLLKLQLLRLPPEATMSVEELREAELVRPAESPGPARVLNQTGAELAALAALLPGTPEEVDYLEQALAGAGQAARMDALRGSGGGSR